MRINEVQRITGLTARAIRFYDERGLIRSRRDRANARHFDRRCLERLQLIAALRRAGVSITDIRCILIMHERDSRDGAALSLALSRLQDEARRLAEGLGQVDLALEMARAQLAPPLAIAAE